MSERRVDPDDLSRPGGRSAGVRFQFDGEAVGRSAEQLARFFGTTRYLVIQTVMVIVWILLNVFAVSLRWDPYPFILLNLAFSTQAAYAAPLILLAQNRQEARGKVSLQEDRSRAVASKADTEFIARELASLRIAMGELATRDFVRTELQRMLTEEPTGPKKKAKKNGPGQSHPPRPGDGSRQTPSGEPAEPAQGKPPAKPGSSARS